MLNKNQLAWSIATAALLAAAGLGGALYRTHETSKKQHELIHYLRSEQTKLGSLSEEETEKHNDTIAELEEALRSAQAAQRSLTEQLFNSEEDVKFLLEELEAAEQRIETAAPTPTSTTAPQIAYLALRKAVIRGKSYHDEWKALEPQLTQVDAAIKVTLSEHVDGIKSRAVLVRELEEIYATASPQEDTLPWLNRLRDVITVRKLDHRPLTRAVERGDIDVAAKHLRDEASDDFADWLTDYDTRRSVLKALDALEAELVAAHG
ncbi:MAG: hypothetical protein J0M34_04215 [Alphaproteobacteria bacterium]|nr:hypothetical protein [Alphaproteobacteria bacterium]